MLAFKYVWCAGMEAQFPAAQALLFGKTAPVDIHTLEYIYIYITCMYMTGARSLRA